MIAPQPAPPAERASRSDERQRAAAARHRGPVPEPTLLSSRVAGDRHSCLFRVSETYRRARLGLRLVPDHGLQLLGDNNGLGRSGATATPSGHGASDVRLSLLADHHRTLALGSDAADGLVSPTKLRVHRSCKSQTSAGSRGADRSWTQMVDASTPCVARVTLRRGTRVAMQRVRRDPSGSPAPPGDSGDGPPPTRCEDVLARVLPKPRTERSAGGQRLAGVELCVLWVRRGRGQPEATRRRLPTAVQSGSAILHAVLRRGCLEIQEDDQAPRDAS